MRVLVVDTYYPPFLDTVYAADPGLAGRSYAEQMAALLDYAFGTGEAYPRELRALGHEAEQVVANALPLQLAWAREHGGARLGPALGRLPSRVGSAARLLLFERILLRQVAAFEPDVVYLQDLWLLRRQALDRLRRRGHHVVGQIASQLPNDGVVRGYDLILTSFPHFVDRIRALGVDSAYLRIAFDDSLLPRIGAGEPRTHDLAFVGGLNPRTHAAGTALLETVAQELPLEVWGYDADALHPRSPLRARYRGEAWGLEMFRVLARSRIVLNRHIDVAEGHANNMRLYEATGTGALLLTDEGSNLAELFEPGREVVTYANPNELVERARWLLEHEEERAAIAAAGQARTLRDHTYARRIAELADILASRLP